MGVILVRFSRIWTEYGEIQSTDKYTDKSTDIGKQGIKNKDFMLCK